MDSPVGRIVIEAEGGVVTLVEFCDGAGADGEPSREAALVNSVKPSAETDTASAAAVDICKAELTEYFSGERTAFTVKFRQDGTAFQKRVWDALYDIPYGETRSYGETAAAICRPRAVRAVGGANHSNNISIIVPCHRVIGADGRLTGYGGGLWRKEWLLGHERAVIAGRAPKS